MKLLIDAGNSRVKWWLYERNLTGVVCRGQLDLMLADIGTVAAGDQITDIRISCVAGTEVVEGLLNGCRNRFSVEPLLAEVQSPHVGLNVAYRDISRLGVDRWLAMVAAVRMFPGRSLMILDAGSALTVDFVAGDGQHLGGLIMPGVQMMAKALFKDTSRVAVESLTLPQKWQPGCDTLSCVEQGVGAAFSGVVTEIGRYRDMHLKSGGLPLTLVTGGDALWFAERFSGEVLNEPLLVMQGLLYIVG